MPEPGIFVRFKEQINPPKLTTVDLTGKTVVVVGANAGLGFEATKHFAQMNPGKLILACRNKEKGEAAVTKIKEETGYQTAELWIIDLSEFSSVIAFAERFEKEGGGRLDILLCNAAVILSTLQFTTDGWELSYQTNYLSGSLLSLLLLPTLLETARKYNTTPRITFVNSGGIYIVKTFVFNLSNVPNSLRYLAHKDGLMERLGKKKYGGWGIYRETKVTSHMFTRALNDRLFKKPIIVNSVDPGTCVTTIAKDFGTLIFRILFTVLFHTIGRTAEEGSRPLVWAAVGGEEKKDELRGAFVNSVAEVEETTDYILSNEGRSVQEKLWDETIDELIKVEPKVQQIVEKCLTPKAHVPFSAK